MKEPPELVLIYGPGPGWKLETAGYQVIIWEDGRISIARLPDEPDCKNPPGGKA